jgi:hypothetical protein
MPIGNRQAATFLVALVTLGGDLFAAGVQADEVLRWKFKVGEKLDYKMVQDMQMSAVGTPTPQVSMHQEMNMTWDVQGVDDKSGEAVIRQKFERVKMKMSTPAVSFEYDSKSEEAPTGLGARIAPMYKAMTEGEFEITMTSRGEVKDVKIPEQVLAVLKNSPNAAEMGDIATSEGFKKMISQGALVLPKDAPKKGETWSTKVVTQNPPVGKQTIETVYRYDGTKDIKGTMVAVIKPELKMEFEKQAAEKEGQPKQPASQQGIQMKIKEQNSDGEVLFNVGAGRLQSTSLKHNVTTEASVGGQPIQQQKIEQKIDVTVTPAGEKKADEAKKPETSGKAEKAGKAK